MKRRTGTGRWRWALMLPVLVFLLGESSGQRGGAVAAVTRAGSLRAGRGKRVAQRARRAATGRDSGSEGGRGGSPGASAWLAALAGPPGDLGTYGPRRYSGRERSGLELFHQALLVVGQAVQRLTDLGRFLGLARQRLGDVTDRRDIAVDLLGYRALFLGGAGNL